MSTAPVMRKGGKYNWKGQAERLVYLGRNWSGNGFWHQFEKVDAPGVVWCEVLDDQLESFEETLIVPVEVVRDEDGSFVHPGMPSFEEGSGDQWRAWLVTQGLRVSRSMLEDEALNHPVYVSYFDDGGGSYAGWVATPPAGDGWFTLAIYDSEDGPVWCWARRDA